MIGKLSHTNPLAPVIKSFIPQEDACIHSKFVGGMLVDINYKAGSGLG
jgi:hypothetical protein